MGFLERPGDPLGSVWGGSSHDMEKELNVHFGGRASDTSCRTWTVSFCCFGVLHFCFWFWWCWGLSPGPHTCKTRAPPAPELHPSPPKITFARELHDRADPISRLLQFYQGNGGCHSNAVCSDTKTGKRTCTCKQNYVGNGFTCRGHIYEVTHGPLGAGALRATPELHGIQGCTKVGAAVFVKGGKKEMSPA